MKLPKITLNKTIINLSLIVAALIILLLILKGHRDDNRALKLLTEARDSAKNALIIVDNLQQKINDLERKDTETGQKIDSVTTELTEKDKEIKQNLSKIDNLKVSIAKNKKNNNTPALLDDCDSLLAFHNTSEKFWSEYAESSNNIITLYKSDLFIKDSIITVKGMQINTLKSTVQFMQDKLDASMKDVKQRNQVFIGGEIVGNKQLLITGAGVNLSLLNKTGQMFEIKAININSNMYYGIGAKFRLSFRK